ncbi:MAG: 4-hydroxybenzoate octaprenyltransferase [Hyphomonadaceae bacterium]
MTALKSAASAPADAIPSSWVERAPAALRPFLRLSRYDRPVGFWLLGLPCLIGVAAARMTGGWTWEDVGLAALFAIGAIAMRGAGCTYNDILDRDIDGGVERTALRPLPSGAVSLKGAWGWLLIQCLVGLAVLLCIPRFAQIVALGSIPLVALYPLMKRITWWPQAWLGLTFNWGVLVAIAAIAGEIRIEHLVLYAGLICWTISYDTIYAIQDREDDALIGVKSTARLFENNTHLAVGIIYAMSAALAAVSGYLIAGPLGAVASAPFAIHLAAQVWLLHSKGDAFALTLFRANREAGILLAAGWAALGLLA